MRLSFWDFLFTELLPWFKGLIFISPTLLDVDCQNNLICNLKFTPTVYLCYFSADVSVSPKASTHSQTDQCNTVCIQQPHRGDKALLGHNDYLQLPQKPVLSKLMLVLFLADTLERQCEHQGLYTALKDSRRSGNMAMLDHVSQFSTLEVAAY